MNPALYPVDIVRVGASGEVAGRDVAATEEPLEIRLGSASFVTIMRTPGSDEQLAAGFLLSEQIVTAPDQVGSIRHCADDDGCEIGNVLNVWLAARAAASPVSHTLRTLPISQPSSSAQWRIEPT